MTATSASPIFPIPSLSQTDVEALTAARLVEFYRLNAGEFTMLVAVFYENFLKNAVPLIGPAEPAQLFRLFCQELVLFFTAASPHGRAASGENLLAQAFLWGHLRREGLVTWQDFWGSERGELSKVDRLVSTWVHYVVRLGFDNGAANHASDPHRVREAAQVIAELNDGRRQLRAV